MRKQHEKSEAQKVKEQAARERRAAQNTNAGKTAQLMMGWRRTIIQNIDGLMELSTAGVVKALREGDPTICLLIFKLLYSRSHAWRRRMKFADDPATARKELESAFADGQLSTDEYGVLIRGRELQLKIAEAEAMKDKLASMEEKITLLLAQQQGGSNGETQLPARWDGKAPGENNP